MYTMSVPSNILRLNGVLIAQDDRTPEYQAFLVWLGEGNGPVEIPDPIQPPRLPHVSCTPWQFRKALNLRGLREQFDAHVATLDQDARDGVEYATSWESDDPILLANLAPFGMTEDDLHAFISFASTLNKHTST